MNWIGWAKEIFLPTLSLPGPAAFRAHVLSLSFEESGNPLKVHAQNNCEHSCFFLGRVTTVFIKLL